ncbi:MAG: CDP-alcohol phosphatidyltransferase family protein [Candidatus Heimdallarchaeota archaeon]|nr:CDP-alcohol phosphatidyltransferase family protein [Candidatus Heimdallarchaeota archaeon]
MDNSEIPEMKLYDSNTLGYFIFRRMSYNLSIIIAKKMAWITPNLITTLNLMFNFVASIIIIKLDSNKPTLIPSLIITFLLISAALLDYMDGDVARIMKKSSKFGAFYDLLCDRFADVILFGSIFFYLLLNGFQLESYLPIVLIIVKLLADYFFIVIDYTFYEEKKNWKQETDFGNRPIWIWIGAMWGGDFIRIIISLGFIFGLVSYSMLFLNIFGIGFLFGHIFLEYLRISNNGE